MLFWQSGTNIFIQDYVLTGYIAEVINTVSNLTYRMSYLFSHRFLHFQQLKSLKKVSIT